VPRISVLIASLIALLGGHAAHAEWRAAERVKTYAIQGQSGPELYASIGVHGPSAKGVRSIAHTGFTLTWRRDYQRRGADCVLASAIPKLTITYTLPEAPKRLPSPVAENWARFRAGVLAHEKVHGDHIKAMVGEIERISVGLTVAEDPQCKKIRAELTEKLKIISAAERQTQRDFDRVEMGDRGAVHQLILMLVNGG